MKEKFVKEYNKSRSWTFLQESFSISKIILENKISKEKNSELHFFSTLKKDSHQMTHEILPHVLNRFYRISSYGMYPVHAPGPKPAGITTPNDLTVFLPLLLSIFKLLLEISHPSPLLCQLSNSGHFYLQFFKGNSQ